MIGNFQNGPISRILGVLYIYIFIYSNMCVCSNKLQIVEGKM